MQFLKVGGAVQTKNPYVVEVWMLTFLNQLRITNEVSSCTLPSIIVCDSRDKLLNLKEVHHALCTLKKLATIFSSSSFAIRVNLRHP